MKRIGRGLFRCLGQRNIVAGELWLKRLEVFIDAEEADIAAETEPRLDSSFAIRGSGGGEAGFACRGDALEFRLATALPDGGDNVGERAGVSQRGHDHAIFRQVDRVIGVDIVDAERETARLGSYGDESRQARGIRRGCNCEIETRGRLCSSCEGKGVRRGDGAGGRMEGVERAAINGDLARRARIFPEDGNGFLGHGVGRRADEGKQKGQSPGEKRAHGPTSKRGGFYEASAG